jgi:signal transduction histidine kinase
METNKSHILYIDDEKENLSGFKYVFKKHYHVHVAISADQGWEVLKEHPIKVIITDQRMPRTTGTQFLEKAAREYPSIFRIILTGYTDVQDIIAAINKGKIFQFIRKPWDKDEVKVIIDNAIQLYDVKEHNTELLASLQSKNIELEEINQTLEEKVTERTKQLEEHKQNLEEKVKERTKQLEMAKDKAEESDRLKSAFLANVSHEIRTPMNAIIGFSELLTTEELTEEDKQEFKDQIILNSNSLLRLIDDIIDISKIEANQITIEYGNHDLNLILSELYTIYNEQKANLGREQIELIIDTPKQQNLIINTDKIRLHQVLSNLIGNAFKFTEKGKITFGYKLTSSNNNQPVLRFHVADTGIGIPEEAHSYIFERFRKADANKEKIFRGTGLGLFICRNLIEKFKGKIWIESELDKGTTFFFDIPYLPGNEVLAEKPTPQVNFANGDYNFTDKTILVAEDEDSSYHFIENIIRETKATIVRAKNGQEALDIVNNQNNVDLILMDIQMPVMNGYEAISLIKEEKEHIPIIAQTAYALVNQKDQVMESGCDDFLAKPFQKNDLLSTIKKYIG